MDRIVSASDCSCWRPLSILRVSRERFTGPQTGRAGDAPRAFVAPVPATRPTRSPRSWSSFGRCSGMRKPVSPARPSRLPIAKELPKGCSAANTCVCFAISLPPSLIRGAPKAGAIRCRACWPSRRPRPCAGCAATKPSPLGRKISNRERASALAVVANRESSACRVNPSFVTS